MADDGSDSSESSSTGVDEVAPLSVEESPQRRGNESSAASSVPASPSISEAKRKWEQLLKSNMPAASKLARDRKIRRNSYQPKKKQRTKIVGASYLSKKDPQKLRARLIEFHGEGLSIRSENIYCSICNKEIGSKKSVIKTHIFFIIFIFIFIFY